MSPKSDFAKLCLLAGGGDLPRQIYSHLNNQGKDCFVVKLDGFADNDWQPVGHKGLAIGQLGKLMKALKDENCDSICFAGYVKRPDFSALKVDFEGAKLLPKVLKAARSGDDALLTTLVNFFEKQGLKVVGAEQVFADLVFPKGVLGEIKPDETALKDIQKAAALITGLGAFDVGQAAIVCEGLVLAIEAAEGTDSMLERVAGLADEIRGNEVHRKGVLVKRPKPNQEKRIDLPVIGVRTVENAAKAGLSGIAASAGESLLLKRDDIIKKANELGLFVYGADFKAPHDSN